MSRKVPRLLLGEALGVEHSWAWYCLLFEGSFGADAAESQPLPMLG